MIFSWLLATIIAPSYTSILQRGTLLKGENQFSTCFTWIFWTLWPHLFFALLLLYLFLKLSLYLIVVVNYCPRFYEKFEMEYVIGRWILWTPWSIVPPGCGTPTGPWGYPHNHPSFCRTRAPIVPLLYTSLPGPAQLLPSFLGPLLPFPTASKISTGFVYRRPITVIVGDGLS